VLWWAIQTLQRHTKGQPEVVPNWSHVLRTDQHGAPLVVKLWWRSNTTVQINSRRNDSDASCNQQLLPIAPCATSAVVRVVQESAFSQTEEFIADEIRRINDSVHT